MTQVQATTHPYITTAYPDMIRALFKPMNTPDQPHNNKMHAAIGFAGEAVSELQDATDPINFIEEAGDLEFYLQAWDLEIDQRLVNQSLLSQHLMLWTFKPNGLQSALTNLIRISGDMLDCAKKPWVYNKVPDYTAMEYLRKRARLNLDYLYVLFGTSQTEVQLANKKKLIGPGGRFESGFYSDAAAQARADKA